MGVSPRALLAVAVMLAGIVACRQANNQPPSAPLPQLDACTLLEYEDADPGGQLGLARVKAPIDTQVGQESAKCSYGTPSPPIMLVSLEVRRFPSAAAAVREQKTSEGMLESLSGVDSLTVAGTGDRAKWAGGRLNQLHVVSGQLRLIVTVEVGGESWRSTHAVDIATRALERLTAPSPQAGS